MESNFVEWEGSVYRIDRGETGLTVFKKAPDGSFAPAPNAPFATIEYEGLPVSAPANSG